MFGRILCPVDFSPGSRHAMDYASALARSFGARVAALYVHTLPLPLTSLGHPETMSPPALTDQERTDILQHLADFVACDRASGVVVDTVFEEALSVAPAIVETAGEDAADLIVMGTHGRTGFTRLVLGSVANRVMKTAPCPVLIVPPRTTASGAPSFQRVVAACDFSPASTRALEAAAAIAARTGAQLTAVHVLDLPGELPEHRQPAFASYRTARFEQARASLGKTVSALAQGSSEVGTLLVVGKPYEEILQIAAEHQADLLVIGVHGHGILDPLMFGTTTHRVVRQATCPVLIVRAA